MPTLRTKSVAVESPANPNHRINNEQAQTAQTQNKSLYEQSREQRIKENLERMQKLGIVDISLQLKSNIQPRRTIAISNRCTTPAGPSPIRQPGPLRRSSRLQNSTPVSYSEVHVDKKEEALYKKGIMLEEGAKPEIYTEGHEKLLGSTEKSWTLFVDGYGKNGKRIYDPVRGKTCHQCRQKTLGHHTQCSMCNKVQGQFCGDCLYMRYGEHVLEASQNPNWTCPVCRGICNCSLCRTAKGWPPTGTLYKKISQLGFKSVAHYLIQTHRSQTNLGQNPETTNQVSAKRSLHFPDVDASCEEIVNANDNDSGSTKPPAEHEKDDDFKSENENDMPSSTNLDVNNQTSENITLAFPDMAQHFENFGSPEVNDKVSDNLGWSNPQSETIGDYLEGEKDNKMLLMDMTLGDSSNTLGTSSKSKLKPALDTESNADSIAGRLRQRRMTRNDHDDELPDAKQKTPEVEQDVNKILSEKEVEKEKVVLFTDKKHDGDSSTALDISSKVKRKRALAADPSSDSIAGRLRQRRKANSNDDEN